MIAALKRLSADDKSQFDRDGFHVARGLFTTRETDFIREVFQEQGDQGPTPPLQVDNRLASNDPLARYPRMMMPHRYPGLRVGRVAMSVMLDPRIGHMLHDLSGEEAVAAQTMFYFKPPGARGQALHQDNFYLRVAPATCMAAWVAVDDADEENGGLMVVPGSHCGELACPEKADPAASFTTEHVAVPEGLREVPAILKAGDVLFFNGTLIHGSYPNTSPDRFRRALICHYAPASLREIANAYKPLISFKQTIIEGVAEAAAGGPCGSEFTAVESA